MKSYLPIRIIGGDFGCHRSALLGVSGIVVRQHRLLWHEVKAIGAQEKTAHSSQVRAVVGAVVAGASASLVFGPLGIAAASLAGGLVNKGKTQESFEIWLHDGRSIQIAAAEGTMVKAREWRELFNSIRSDVMQSIETLPAKPDDHAKGLGLKAEKIAKRLPRF